MGTGRWRPAPGGRLRPHPPALQRDPRRPAGRDRLLARGWRQRGDGIHRRARDHARRRVRLSQPRESHAGVGAPAGASAHLRRRPRAQFGVEPFGGGPDRGDGRPEPGQSSHGGSGQSDPGEPHHRLAGAGGVVVECDTGGRRAGAVGVANRRGPHRRRGARGRLRRALRHPQQRPRRTGRGSAGAPRRHAGARHRGECRTP